MEPFTRISVQKAHELMSLGPATIVDVRDPASFEQAHMAQAQNLNNENIDGFLKNADKEQPLICYCYHGISSQQAALFFAGQGFKQVYSMDGGWEEWRSVYG